MPSKGEKVVRRLANLIGGEWTGADSGAELVVEDAATGAPIGAVPDAGTDEVNRAVGAAEAALSGWGRLVPDARSQILRTFAQRIRDNTESLAEMVTAESGKPLSEATAEVSLATAFIEWAAEEGRRIVGEMLPSNVPGKQLLVARRPVGVVGAITPWNFPVALVARKTAPALAAGCSVVLKPSERTPLSALMLGELALESGMPAGALNIVTGSAEMIASALVDHPEVRLVSFTGSGAAGKWLIERSAGTVTRLVLELSGHAPFLVFADADIDTAAADAVAVKYRNAGQTCVAPDRFLIQDAVYDQFCATMTALVAKLQVGDGRAVGIDVGPMISDAVVDRLRAQIADAVDKGARVLTGGATLPLAERDRFFQPTVIAGWTDDMLLSREETFGPVASLRSFGTEEEAIAIANNGPQGLAAYVYTSDPARTFRMIDQLECGILGVNDVNTAAPQVPLGGIKQSGWGREGGRFGLDPYLDLKYVDWRP